MNEVKETPPMSLRERQVLRLIALGNADKQIAAELGIALGTVRSYNQRSKSKLGTTDQASSAALAVALGIVSPSEVAQAFGFAYRQTALELEAA